MKRIFSIITLFIVLFAQADEGMYLPFTVKQNYADMKALGVELKPADIYSTKKPSLKDAIVSFGGFCTAEIISPQGLLLTNHHCGYDAIAESSTPENDYLTDGFWAYEIGDEIPIPGLTASIIVRVEDVTAKINSQLHAGLDEDERKNVIGKISKEISQQAVEGTHYKAYVKDFYDGNEFYLFVTEVFEDIRMVGAPPSAIGKFGGDTDNWMWERQTGDFSMFRIYAGKDNKPAAYSTDNQPYSPKHYLPISIKGIQEGDYSMIFGFPGRTNRYLTSHGVKMALDKDQPTRVKIRGKKLEIMKAEMDKSDAVRIQYASTYAQVSNYWKYYIGQSEQLTKNKVYDKKVAIENDFQNWVNENPKRIEKYGNVLTDMSEAYGVLTNYANLKVYYSEAFASLGITRFMSYHYQLYSLLKVETTDQEKVNAYITDIAETAASHFENLDLTTEINLYSEMFNMYYNNVDASQHSKEFIEYYEKNIKAIGWNKFVTDVLSKSMFAQKELYQKFTESPNKEAFENDELFNLFEILLSNYRNLIYGSEATLAQQKLDKANRLFIAGLREMNPKKNYYPNANSTLRLTYGTIQKYHTNDKQYDYFTNIESMMAKEDPSNEEFIIPAKLKELYEKKDYGRYGQDGTLWLNFLSNNDITGGNSGSPVINAKGELIGCAFDGNWEAMSGDIAFEPELQRTISCDIRYILFIIDKYAGATRLIDEMTIVE